MVRKPFPTGQAPSLLYRLGISYHATGIIRDDKTKTKLFDFYRVDSVTPEKRAELLEHAPDVQFKIVGPQFAPEIRKVAICFPKAGFYRLNPESKP